MNEHISAGQRAWLWRSRWAAIGAAIAVSLGGGGVFWAHADDPDDPAPTLEEFIEARESLSIESSSSKHPTWSDPDPVSVEPLTTDAGVAGAAFVPVRPYRSFDSRAFTSGIIEWGQSGTIELSSNESGTQMIPANAVAVTYNLTVTGTFGYGGYLALYPAASSWPGNSSINWFAPGIDMSNGGVVGLSSGDVGILCGEVFDTATDFIIDVTGYYIR